MTSPVKKTRSDNVRPYETDVPRSTVAHKHLQLLKSKIRTRIEKNDTKIYQSADIKRKQERNHTKPLLSRKLSFGNKIRRISVIK